MADQVVAITVPDAHVNEVRAAIGRSMNMKGLAGSAEIKQFIRSHIRAAVLKYRESQRADIDRSDPTTD